MPAAPESVQFMRRSMPSTGTEQHMHRSRFSLAAISVAVVVLFGAIKLARPMGRPFTMTGDVAYIEIGVRQALQHGTALGVYSRYGWHHPGPALFYVYAPLYWLSGHGARSLFVSAWLINGVSALVAVCIVRARAGERTARVFVFALFALGLGSGVRHFIDPWNPKVLALPLLLLMVSAAAAFSGSAWSFVVALVAATYLVQTHLGTLPVAACLLVLAAAGFWRNRKGSLRVPVVVAVGVLALLWIGPAVQEISHSDGNLSQIAEFYAPPRHVDQTSHSLKSSLIVVSNHATVVPLGTATSPGGNAARLLLAGTFAGLGAYAAFVTRQRAPFIAALGLATTVGLAAAVIAALRVIGPQDGFLFYWTEVLPIPAIVAGVWIVIERAHTDRTRNAVDVGTAIVLVLFLLFSVREVALARPTTLGDAAQARTIAKRIEQDVGSKNRPFAFSLDTTRVDAGSIAVQLDKDGYRFRMDPPVNLYGGNVSDDTVTDPAFIVRSVNLPAPPHSRERHLATFGSINLFVER
jgi:hypothetical protein